MNQHFGGFDFTLLSIALEFFHIRIRNCAVVSNRSVTRRVLFKISIRFHWRILTPMGFKNDVTSSLTPNTHVCPSLEEITSSTSEKNLRITELPDATVPIVNLSLTIYILKYEPGGERSGRASTLSTPKPM